MGCFGFGDIEHKRQRSDNLLLKFRFMSCQLVSFNISI